MQERRSGQGNLNAQQLQSIRAGQRASKTATRSARPAQVRPTSRGSAARSSQGGAGKARPVQAVRSKPSKKARKFSNLQMLALLLLPPVGIPVMWGRRCGWPKGVKIGVSVAIAAIFAVLVILPGTDHSRTLGGIQLVSSKPEVEIYGPAIPATTMPAYTNAPGSSIISAVDEDEVEYVYAAEGAECYHRYDCKFAYASSQRLTVYEAYFLGYRPCGRCDPPKYEG